MAVAVVVGGERMVVRGSRRRLGSARLGEGVMTVGIPVGFGVIVFTILITGFYVRRANSEFDQLTREIVEEAGK